MHNVYLFGHILFHYTGVYGNNVLQNKEICKADKQNSLFCRPKSGTLHRVDWYCTCIHECYQSKGAKSQNTWNFKPAVTRQPPISVFHCGYCIAGEPEEC